MPTPAGKCAQFVEMGNLQQVWSNPNSPYQCRACKCRKLLERLGGDREDKKRANGIRASGRVKKIGGSAAGIKPVKLSG